MSATLSATCACAPARLHETTIDDCRLIDLARIPCPEGSITPVEQGENLPFHISRVYYLYDVPGGACRGGHAHLHLQQFVVSLMGSFELTLNDGRRRKTIALNRAYYGVYIPPMIWRELVNFSSGGICVVLASLPYDENEYIRDYDAFLKQKEFK
ncbi:MAG: FdtA/QdtA family cupin domain-containing protein [Lentisphaerota bacterium]